MSFLILGQGGREHALAWKLSQKHTVFLHPGNSATSFSGFSPLESDIHSIEALTLEIQKRNIDLILIGPEVYLEKGYADYFRNQGLLVVGPSQKAAQLETSKVFAKEFMTRANVPTASYVIVHQQKDLLDIGITEWPVVLKLDGLAAGKGVVIAQNRNEVLDFSNRIWKENEFGKGPHKVILEKFIPGVELSYLGLCDGDTFIPLSSSTDYKRVHDQDKGPNTGGMGVISPSPYLNEALEKKIQSQVVLPILAQFKKEEIDYRGILYIGVMIDAKNNPYILEFNARFGDPETQCLMLRMESDLAPYLFAVATKELKKAPPISWNPKTSVYVVAAAEGYPGKVKMGDKITGLPMKSSSSQVFYSGVEVKNGEWYTSGGRVLGVGALGQGVLEARKLAYETLKQIQWKGIHYRNDIGLRKGEE